MNAELSSSDFGFVRELLRQQAAVSLTQDDLCLVQRRLRPVAEAYGFATLAQLIARLKGPNQASQGPNQASLQRDVVESLITTDASFFPDGHPFDALRTEVLPQLAAARGSEQRLNIWCAACSTGQDPYTIAMIIREYFPAMRQWQIRILGTDLSAPIIDRARAGVYTPIEVNRGLPASLRAKYLTRTGAGWRPVDDIQRMVRFEHLNLLDRWNPALLFDIVFLRNVLIYFDAQDRRTVVARVRGSMRPNGYLFLGGAEAGLSVGDKFHRVAAGQANCFQLQVSGRAA